MTELKLTWRELLYGMFAMNVMYGFTVIVMVIALPIGTIAALWIYAGKILEPNIAIALGIILTAFVEINVIQVSIWCTQALFARPLVRLLTIVILALWHLIMSKIDGAGPMDWSLIAIGALIATIMAFEKGKES